MDKDNRKLIGKRLKLCRNEKNLTQDWLSEKIGIAAKSYSQIETGVRLFSIDVLLNLSDELGVSTDYILKGYTTTDNSPIMELIKDLSPKDVARAEEILRLFAESAQEKYK